MIGRRRVVGGSVAVVLVVGGVFGGLAASSGAPRPVAKPAAAAPLGSVTALSWGVRTPVGERLVLRPYASFELSPRAVRASSRPCPSPTVCVLRAAKPRLYGSLVARIVTAPVRGRSRTLVVVSRRVNGLLLGTGVARRRLNGDPASLLPRWVLTRKQTQVVKRAAARGPLAITVRARHRVSYIKRKRRVVTPTRSHSVTLPFALKRQPARGGNLRTLAVTFRRLLGRAGQLETACVTRNTILRQLRNTYSTMVSGDRTGAAGLLRVYIRDAEAMGAAGLLNREQSTMLGSELGRILKRVGSGQSKRVERARRWASLPDCGPARARSAQTLAVIIARGIAKRVFIGRIITFPTRRTRKSIIHTVVKDSVNAEYPEDTSQASLDEAAPAGDPTDAQPVLDDLKAQMDNYTYWAECCLANNPALAASYWNDAMNTFQFNRWRFEPSLSYYSLDDEVELLPLFSQYINMYLSMLQDGVVFGPRWGLTPDAVLTLEDKIRAELNPNGPSAGCTGYQCPGGDAMAYSKRVYDAGLAQQGSSTNPQTNFANTNAYKREMQISVLDVRDQWHLSDPMGYPYGDPNFKLDRMIYSDAVGTTTQTFAAPANPVSPLSALTAWTTRVTAGSYTNRNWLTAVQADNSPQVGARTGATTGTPTTYNVAPDSTLRPITQVDTTQDQKSSSSQKVIGTVQLHFSNGTTAAPGGDFYDRGSSNTTSWAFDGEVLAAAKIMGSYAITSSTAVADSLVLGFRQADSFAPSWHGSLPGARRAPNTQACLGVEQLTITSGAHIGATTGSRADGAALQMRNCSSTAWDQIWKYIDYDNPDDAEDDADQRELTVYANTKCMAPKTDASGNWATGGGFPTASSTTWPPPPHTLVGVYDCNETDAQKWTVNTDGTIRPANANNLCLDRWNGATTPGTPIQLYTCSPGNAAQQWTRP